MRAKKSKRRKKRYLYAHPDNGHMVSRQRIWQLRQRAKGRCVRCGTKAKTYRCEDCQEKHLESQKKAA